VRWNSLHLRPIGLPHADIARRTSITIASVCLSVCLFVLPSCAQDTSVPLSIWLLVFIFTLTLWCTIGRFLICMSGHYNFYDVMCMYVCLYVCLSVCMSVCLSVCLYVCQSASNIIWRTTLTNLSQNLVSLYVGLQNPKQK